MVVRGAQTATSAANGTLTLNFATLKPGDRVPFRSATKAGYEIFNKAAVESWNISRDKTPFVIVLVRSDYFTQLKQNLKQTSVSSYKTKYEKAKADLAKQQNEGKLKEAEYRQKLKLIDEEEYRRLEAIDKELAALLHTFGVTDDLDGNADGYRLVLCEGDEVHVDSLVGDRMPLKLVQDGGIGLSIVKLEVHDVRLRSVGEALELLRVDGEEDIVHTETIKVARDEALTAESLDDGFVGGLTDLAFQFKMLHCFFVLKCVTQAVLRSPHCTKKRRAFSKCAAKIGKKSYWTSEVALFQANVL